MRSAGVPVQQNAKPRTRRGAVQRGTPMAVALQCLGTVSTDWVSGESVSPFAVVPPTSTLPGSSCSLRLTPTVSNRPLQDFGAPADQRVPRPGWSSHRREPPAWAHHLSSHRKRYAASSLRMFHR